MNTENLAYLKSRGKSGGTWIHPVLFVKFAMWLNPRFEVQVIKFVYDEMIKYRNKASINSFVFLLEKNSFKSFCFKWGEFPLFRFAYSFHCLNSSVAQKNPSFVRWVTLNSPIFLFISWFVFIAFVLLIIPVRS